MDSFADNRGLVCSNCGAVAPPHGIVYFCACGNEIETRCELPQPYPLAAGATPLLGTGDYDFVGARCDINPNAYVCRSGCEHYDEATNACKEVIRLGSLKGTARAGSVDWLHFNHWCPCPVGKFSGDPSATPPKGKRKPS